MKGNNVVVHCKGGLGRAPTFVASCLIYSGVNLEEALTIIKNSRQGSSPSFSQRNFLNNLTFK